MSGKMLCRHIVFYAWGEPKKLTKALHEKRLRSGRLKKSAFAEFSAEWQTSHLTLSCLKPRMAFRDITNRTNTRTTVAALLPGEVFLQNTAPFLLWPEGDEKDQAFLLGVLSSLSLDWCSRVRGGINGSHYRRGERVPVAVEPALRHTSTSASNTLNARVRRSFFPARAISP